MRSRVPIVALLALASIAGCSKDPEIFELKVLTLNVRRDVDFWERRFPLIADEIVRLEPDLIGFQEVNVAIDQQKRLHDLISGRNVELEYDYHAQRDTGTRENGGGGIAVFSRYPIITRLAVDLGEGRPASLERIRLSP